MNADKISQLIKDKNDRIERQVTQDATGLIEEIMTQQGLIVEANNRIAQLRAELKSLEAVTVDASTILGQ